MAKVVGPPVIVAATDPLIEQDSWNHEPLTFTGSLKVTDRLAPTGKSVAPSGGYVPATWGAASDAEQELWGVAELRGVGVPAAKSDALLSVSAQPLVRRSAAVVLLK